jgi:drug/metabolite transporter (DMT)-like permease
VLPAPRLAGIVVALAAVVLISLPSRAPGDVDAQRRLRIDLAELPLVVVSGLGFAGFFIFIGQASAAGPVWWPLAIVRVVGLIAVLAALIVLVARGARALRGAGGTVGTRTRDVLGLRRLAESGMRPAAVAAIVGVAAMGDLGGNAFFVLATQAGDFAVAVILSSLYPVVTTLLAALFLHERLRPIQILGVVLATLSIVLLR